MSKAQRAYQEVCRELEYCNVQLQHADKLSERRLQTLRMRKEMCEEMLHELALQLVR